jgi:hypothetical protein
MKAEVYRHWGASLVDAAHDPDALAQEALRHPDATEGVASFVERRPPNFARPDPTRLPW